MTQATRIEKSRPQEMGAVPPSTSAPGGALSTAILHSQAELDELRSEWLQLYADCPTATPFLAHAWVAAWARAYCPDGSLRVVLVRSAGHLVAAVPLCLVRRRGWPALVPLGAGISDYTDVLLAGDHDPVEVWAAVTRALLAERGWRLVELPELRPDALALQWATHWPGGVARLQGATSLELPGLPMPDLLGRLPSRTAGVIRRKLRKTDTLGLASAEVPQDRAADAVVSMLRLHEEQWRGRGINVEHLTDRFGTHLAEALPRMVSDRQAAVVEHRLDGELLGCHVQLIGHDILGYYLAGISPALKARIDVASMLIRHDVETTVGLGLSRYSMMRGEEDYKLRWRPDRVAHQRLVLARPGLLGAAGYPTVLRFKQAVERWAGRRSGVRDVLTAIASAVRLGRGRPADASSTSA